MSLEVLGPQHLLDNHLEPSSAAAEYLLSRLISGSQRGERDDGLIIALAIEGGGTAGAVSAGMCAFLEQTGLIAAVDRIYGTSAGALNGAFTASGQAALGTTNYIDILTPRFASFRHLKEGKSIVYFDYLFNDVAWSKEAHDFAAMQNGPDFGALSVNLDSGRAEVLRNFQSEQELTQGLRASCAMPVYAGGPVDFRGNIWTDGALLASVPVEAALDEKADYVLALRTRSAEYRKSPYPWLQIQLIKYLEGIELAELVRDRPRIYNHMADALQHGDFATVTQIAPKGEKTPVDQLEKSEYRIRQGFKLGALAMAEVFGIKDLDVRWNFIPRIMIDPATLQQRSLVLAR